MAATVASIIASGRFDLRDVNSTQYTDPELLDYLNRERVQLDAVLSTQSSDYVFTEDTGNTTLDEDDNSVAAPSGCIKIRQLWIDRDQLTPMSPDYIYYKRKYVGTGAGQPYYFTEVGTNILFERTADDDYDLDIYFDKRSDALTSSGNMPYDDVFNQPFREAMVLIAKKRQEYDVNLDAVLFDFFMAATASIIVKRRWNRRPYRLGF